MRSSIFTTLKARPRLFVVLWAVPLIFNIIVGQMANITDSSYKFYLPIPEKIAILGPSILIGGLAAIVNTLLFLFLLNIGKQLHICQYFQRYIWLHAMIWAVLFTLGSTYGFLMGAACPNPGSLITHLGYGVQGFLIGGFIASLVGFCLAIILSLIFEALRRLTKI